LDLVFSTVRPWRTNWLMVGIEKVPKRFSLIQKAQFGRIRQ